jgi:Cellulase (glycosyl hydrolase family 5)
MSTKTLKFPKGNNLNDVPQWDNVNGAYVPNLIQASIINRAATTSTATTDGLPQTNQEAVNQELDARIKAGKLLTFNTTLTGTLTGPEEATLSIGLSRNQGTGERWLKTTEGTVTKIEQKNFLTYETFNSGVLTAAQELALQVGITKNITTKEVWLKTIDGKVTKIENPEIITSVPEKVLQDYVNSWSGYNIQGLESGSPSSPGIIGINYIANHDTKYIDWLVSQGIKTYRIPFMLERLCPVPMESTYTDQSYANIIKDFITRCNLRGIQCFVDAHNYGSYTFQANATMSSVGPVTPANFYSFFDSRYQIVSNKLQIRNPTNTSLSFCYENIFAGQKNNPTPAKIDTVVQITSTAGQTYNSLLIAGCYIDDKNYLGVNVNATLNNAEFIQRLNGVDTVLATVSVPSATLNSNITVAFNLGKLGDPTYNTWNATVNGVTIYNQPVATAPIDSKFTQGQWGYKTQGVNADIVSYLYTIYGTTAAQGYASASTVYWGKTVGSRSYDVLLHEFFYQEMFKAFDGLAGMVGYMYNEPHDLLTPTTPANYKTTATATIYQQVALNKLRQLGSDKWFGWTSDNYGGIQNIIASGTGPAVWGQNFDVPFFDPIDKTFFDFHYYPDFYSASIYSGSGTYGSIAGSGPVIPYTATQITASIEPVLQRVDVINAARKVLKKPKVPLMLSEIGIPENATWWPALTTICQLLKKYNCPFMYFGIGEFFPNDVNNISADPNVYIYPNGVKQLSLTLNQERHRIITDTINIYKP